MTFVTKFSNQNFIICLNKTRTTVTGYKDCDFWGEVIRDQPDADTLPDGRIWLFGFNLLLFSLCMGGASKSVGFQGCAQMGLSALFIMPLGPRQWLWSFLAAQRPSHLPILLVSRA